MKKSIKKSNLVRAAIILLFLVFTALPIVASGSAPVHAKCGEGELELSNPITRNGSTTSCIKAEKDDQTPLSQNPIIVYLAVMIRFVTIGVGVIVTVVIVIAGIRYTWARGNPQEVAAAKDMIGKALIGLVMYLFSGAIINWLVPGGLL